MKSFKYSNKWKTDPRAAYIPGALLASIVFVVCIAALPAWSFETIESDQTLEGVNSAFTTSYPSQPSSPTVVDPCLPLLKSIRHTPPQSTMDRNQRSAGKAAALGLVLGVRFALAPPQKTGSRAAKPRLDIWQPAGASTDRSALAVTAYRQCQKEQALKALSEFRWTR